jgi:hypothetical protein
MALPLIIATSLLCIRPAGAADPPFLPFAPKPDPYNPASPIDLRSLNEPLAGDHGFIAVKDEDFIQSATGKHIRFWAVTNCPGTTYEELTQSARVLAKHGVNQVRLHGAMFTKTGQVDSAAVNHAFDSVDALKHQGIYTHFSIYFPLWYKPATNDPVLQGYDGNTTPFAVLLFNPAFQQQYHLDVRLNQAATSAKLWPLAHC